MSNLNRNPEKDLQLKQSTEQSLSQLASRVEGGLKEKEKTESKEYESALKKLNKNQGNPDQHFRNNLRSVSKILGASEASAENKVLALKVMREISSEKFSKWIGNNTEMAAPIRALSARVLLAPDFAHPEKIRALFLNGDTVDFYGNNSAKRRIGAGDLFDSSQAVLSITSDGAERIGKRSIGSDYSPNKIGYRDATGYIKIEGGEIIKKEVSIPEGEDFDVPTIDSNFEHTLSDGTKLTGEDAHQAVFAGEVDVEEKASEMLAEDCQKQIEEKGLDGIENPTGQQFFEMSKVVALELEKQTGVPWQVTVAQGLLESGHGRSGLATGGKNFFGIKGKGRSYMTKERYNGKTHSVRSSFRHYNSFSESFADHNNLFLRKNRYKEVTQAYKNNEKFQVDPKYIHSTQKGFKGTKTRPLKTPADFLWGIVDSGYATADSEAYIRGAESALSRYGASLGELSMEV